MIVLIDNFDSFVYNLARYVGELGYARTVLRNTVSVADIARLSPTHIIISPGPCAPDQAGVSLQAIHDFGGSVPILGVCLGHQAIGQAFGGVVTRARKPMHGKSSLVSHDGKNLFAGLPNPLCVARYHSLIVGADNFPDALEVTATSEEGEVMALQHRWLKIYGVQFHPESVLTEAGHTLLGNFLSF